MKKYYQLGLALILSTLLIMLTGCADMGRGVNAKKSIISDHVERPPVATEMHNIALLLPMNGEWSASSKAIHNGFLAAYYSQGQGSQKPQINIKVIDTSGKNIIDVYKQTVATGVDMVIGPLTKPEVEALAQMGNALPVPTLALNALDDYRQHTVVNLYQFGLSPQDEAKQAAIKMLQDGYRNVAVVMPNGSWGQGIASAFQNEMQRHGGQIITTFTYTTFNDIDLKIQQFLQIDSSEMHNKKDQPIHYRQDLNAIFLVVDPHSAQQIVPLLKFYTKGTLPLYAISHIYGGFVRQNVDQDIDDVTFCDMPWVITNPADLSPSLQDIRNKINMLWSDSLQWNSRLYALGIDAFNLAFNFNKVLAEPQEKFPGATGELQLDNYNHIYRQVRWTTMHQGIPQGL